MQLVTNGFFWVKEYMPNVPANQQPIIGEGKTIKIRLSWPADQVPEELKQYPEELKQYTTKDGAARVSTRIKAGKFCNWYDSRGKAVIKPLNTELDGKRYQLKIDFVYKEKNPTNHLAPSGFWANAIMFKLDARECNFTPFDELDDEENTASAPVQQAAAPAAQALVNAAPVQQPAQAPSNGLPFAESELGF